MNCSECKAPGMCVCAPAPVKPFVEITDQLVEHLARAHLKREVGRLFAAAKQEARERGELPSDYVFDEYYGSWEEPGYGWNDRAEFEQAKKLALKDIRAILKDLNHAARDATMEIG